jgi:hypothetical protein
VHSDRERDNNSNRKRYGTVRYGTVCYGTVRYSTVRYGMQTDKFGAPTVSWNCQILWKHLTVDDETLLKNHKRERKHDKS